MHIWKARPDAIIRGHWCKKCSAQNIANRKKLGIEEMRGIAERKGGKCLSDIYVDAHTKLLWECSKGHRWLAKPASVKRGAWCRICSGSSTLSIQEMRKLARSRGGKCLSKKYHDNKTPLEWQCSSGHRWYAKPNSIKNGQWCAECSSGLGERICREFFEQIFNTPFPKRRPTWLINSRGNQLELDGYNSTLKIAFEHQGSQHFRENSFFTNSKDTLVTRKIDDNIKRQLCAQHGISLIEVPEIPTILPIHKVRDFIKRACNQNLISLPMDIDSKEINISAAYSTPNAKEAFGRVKKIAQSKNGKCLSVNYINSKTPLLWECGRGHQWMAPPERIIQGSWCRYCGYIKASTKRKISFDDILMIARNQGGKCLSKEYINTKTKLKWECREGHQWDAIPETIKKGHWCPKCGHRNGAIKRKEEAKRKDKNKSIVQKKFRPTT
ncbi:MAG: hypothetical protein QY332_07725 [Anaerolineales bacterium]|nr:MAG: hypothetical protein QY332_07725 [Anaerolineales bacterium]